VIGIQRCPPDRCLGHIHLPFAPYSIAQLLSIIEFRLEDYHPESRCNAHGELLSSLTPLTEQQKNQFRTLTREAIHFITFRTHEVNDIWAILTSLWEKYYHFSLNETKLTSKFLESEIGSIFRQPTFHTKEMPRPQQRRDSSQSNLKRNISIRSTDSTESSVSSIRPSLIQALPGNMNMNTCKTNNSSPLTPISTRGHLV
jgi:hypothetical protein